MTTAPPPPAPESAPVAPPVAEAPPVEAPVPDVTPPSAKPAADTPSDDDLAAALEPWVHARWHEGKVERHLLETARLWLAARAN